MFHGWIVIGLHGHDFLARMLLDRTHGVVQATLTDPAGTDTVIAVVTPGTRRHDDRLDRDQSITVGQRRWHISVWPTHRLTVAAHSSTATMTLGAGAALTVMLAMLTATMTGSRKRALDQVDRATTALREDITRRESVEAQLREREEQLQHLAFHDPLTGLANRLLFHDQVTRAIAAHTGDGSTFAVLFVDLDGFKPINDAYGHHAGDRVLQVTAGRLRDAVRAGDTVARLGGDEFAVIVEHLDGEPEAHATAARVVAVLGEPIDLAGTTVTVTASLGIAVGGPATTADEVLRRADEAMYAAKSAGKSRYVLVNA
ncbi:diguanylate cyclase domain-containing protein [Actinoplanes sp. HUAS TT8]|uniref:diguanylate cyclase domain-containing protein n=1 Tax=Actinoplanes sp. HUAS TT8 TaxID=3447453 RepID=UPI003F52210C